MVVDDDGDELLKVFAVAANVVVILLVVVAFNVTVAVVAVAGIDAVVVVVDVAVVVLIIGKVGSRGKEVSLHASCEHRL